MKIAVAFCMVLPIIQGMFQQKHKTERPSKDCVKKYKLLFVQNTHFIFHFWDVPVLSVLYTVGIRLKLWKLESQTCQDFCSINRVQGGSCQRVTFTVFSGPVLQLLLFQDYWKFPSRCLGMSSFFFFFHVHFLQLLFQNLFINCFYLLVCQNCLFIFTHCD